MMFVSACNHVCWEHYGDSCCHESFSPGGSSSGAVAMRWCCLIRQVAAAVGAWLWDDAIKFTRWQQQLGAGRGLLWWLTWYTERYVNTAFNHAFTTDIWRSLEISCRSLVARIFISFCCIKASRFVIECWKVLSACDIIYTGRRQRAKSFLVFSDVLY